jgi:hypothetical protein
MYTFKRAINVTVQAMGGPKVVAPAIAIGISSGMGFVAHEVASVVKHSRTLEFEKIKYNFEANHQAEMQKVQLAHDAELKKAKLDQEKWQTQNENKKWAAGQLNSPNFKKQDPSYQEAVRNAFKTGEL